MQKSANLWIKFSAIISLVLVLGSLLALLGLAATQVEFDHSHNLSRSAEANLDSGIPVAAARNSVVAAVWSDGIPNNTIDTGSSGNLYLQSGVEITTNNISYWRPKVLVSQAITAPGNIQPLQNLATDPQMVFSSDSADITSTYTVHLVWSAGVFDTSDGLNNFNYNAIKYARCQVVDNYNTCETPVVITQTTSGELRFPTITEDDDHNVHVVWVEFSGTNTQKLFYSYGRINPQGEIYWAPADEIEEAGTHAQDPRLLFHNSRLHLVWDREEAGQHALRHVYDDEYIDDEYFIPENSGRTFNFNDPIYGDYQNGNPGHPNLVAAPASPSGADLLFLAYDVRHPSDSDRYTMMYSRSDNNGISWQPRRSLLSHIQNPSNDNFNAPGSESLKGLRPSLAITTTGSADWGQLQLHAAWQESVYDPNTESTAYQLMYSNLVVTSNPDDAGTWAPKTQITNAETRRTGIRAFDSDYPRSAPYLLITNPAQGGQGKSHLVYLKRSSATEARWDTYYRGFIANTIDPNLITDPAAFGVAHTVNPVDIYFGKNPAPSFDMTYVITLTNKNDINVIGTNLTNTLATTYVTGLKNYNASSGTPNYDPINRLFTWRGDVAPSENVVIKLIATTYNTVPVTSTIINQVDVWNELLDNQRPLRTALAQTNVNNITASPEGQQIIDPENFGLAHQVSPSMVVTNSNQVSSVNLNYRITMTNSNSQVLYGAALTSTLSDKVNGLIGTPQASSGSIATHSGGFSWQGTLNPAQVVNITFIADTKDPLPNNTVVTNNVDVWNTALDGYAEPLRSAQAKTALMAIDLEKLIITHTADPVKVTTTEDSVAPFNINYIITMTNTSSDVISGTHLTNTLSSKISGLVGSPSASIGSISTHTGGFAWSGADLAPTQSVVINFTATTETPTTSLGTIINTVAMWNERLDDHSPLRSYTAVTTVQRWQIYLPLVMKQ